ncbi:MAG: ribonuclease HII [Nitriliruptoraceae bacterium]
MPSRDATRRSDPTPSVTVDLERAHAGTATTIAGVDEVGRGSWAGPLTVGAVVLDLDDVPIGLRDSKRLTPRRREALAAEIHQRAAVGFGEVSCGELDHVGLAAALRLAAVRAVDALPVAPDLVLIDGTVDLLAGHGVRTATVVGGDDRSASIAAASIVAKVRRDAEMCGYDGAHPRYGFAANKGYPSPGHREALATYGPCALHRRSWQPIRKLLTQPSLPWS